MGELLAHWSRVTRALLCASFTWAQGSRVALFERADPSCEGGWGCSISGAGLDWRLDNGFQYLAKKGFCDGADCQRCPTVIGEIGSLFQTVSTFYRTSLAFSIPWYFLNQFWSS